MPHRPSLAPRRAAKQCCAFAYRRRSGTECRGCSMRRKLRRSGRDIGGPSGHRRVAGPAPPCCCRRRDRRGKTPVRPRRHRPFRANRRRSFRPAGTVSPRLSHSGREPISSRHCSTVNWGQRISDAVIHAPQLRINFVQQHEISFAAVRFPDAGVAGVGIRDRVDYGQNLVSCGQVGEDDPAPQAVPVTPVRSRW